MSLQKPSQITRFAKEYYLNKWHIRLIFVVLIVPCSIQYHLQTVTYYTPDDTHHTKIVTTLKGSDSDQDHVDLHHKESIFQKIHVYDSPNTVESFSKDIVKAVRDTSY